MPEDNREFFYYQPPLYRSRRSRPARPMLTIIFVAICVALFFFESFIMELPELSFIPVLAFERPWTFVTSIFLHADIAHLFFNMFALFMFGFYLETRTTTKEYLIIFFAAGILGNIAYLLTDPYSMIPAVGASGSIYGIMGMLAMMYPGLIVYVLYVPMPMIVAAAMWFLLEFTGLFTPSDIAHQAHLAGLLIGALYGLYIRRKRDRPVFFWQR